MEPEETTTSATDTEPEPSTVGEQRCQQYTQFAGVWPTTSLQFDVVEGSRIVFTEDETESNMATTASSSNMLVLEPTRTVYLQLPIRSIPSPATSCVQSDVVGVAQDGSLIRNNEAGLYGVFGADTLVGYALDGFPIYGSSGASTDSCGGMVVAGQYRYQLSPSRDVILNCFSAAPARL